MHYYTSLADLQQYRSNPGVSQSLLKEVLRGHIKQFKPTLAMLYGSALDCFLTSPDLKEDLFQVGLKKRPSQAITDIINDVWADTKDKVETGTLVNMEDYKDAFVAAARVREFGNTWKDDTLWSRLGEGSSYWEELCTAGEKIIITQEEWDKTEKLSILATNHSLTAKYFMEIEGVDHYYQYPLYWKMYDTECKGLCDLIIADHNTKSICLIDIKGTDMKRGMWMKQACKNKNYPIQLSFYLEGIKKDPKFKELLDEGYKLLARWLVIPFDTYTFKPYLVNCSNELIQVGKYGYKEFRNVEIDTKKHTFFSKNKGWYQGLMVYNESVKRGLLDFDIEYVETGGKMNDSWANQYYFE